MGVKPIGVTAMTNAQRQKRHREKRKAERIAEREKYMKENNIIIYDNLDEIKITYTDIIRAIAGPDLVVAFLEELQAEGKITWH
jgi:hypothetical protein